MKVAIRLLVVAAGMLITSLQIFARDVKIIASPGVKTDTISAGELRGVFLMQKRTLRDGLAVEPVLQKGGPAHEAFLNEYLNRDSEEINIYYQGLVFTGKSSMPRQLDTDADVIAYVAGAKSAIGYVSMGTNTEGVKVLAVLPEKPRGERRLLVRVEPEYPRELEQRGIEGIVRLALTVSPKGSVERVQVLGGNPILAEAAVRSVKQWIYSPSVVTSVIDVNIPFGARQ